MPRPKNQHKVALMLQTGLTRQGVEKRMKTGAGSLTFQGHVTRRMKATADLMEEKAISAKIEVQALRDSVITREEVKHDGKVIKQIWIEEINRMRKEAPGKLIGLDEVGVRTALDSITDTLLDRIMSRLENFDNERASFTPEQGERFRAKIAATVRSDRDSR